MNDDSEKLRIDKWLWVARFFKTRSLAVDAVESGKVLVNEVRVKPAKTVGAGDKLDLRLGQYQFLLEILAISNKRGSAPEAQKLYHETDASRERRASLAAQLKVEKPLFAFKGRPTKRDRRLIAKFKHGE